MQLLLLSGRSPALTDVVTGRGPTYRRPPFNHVVEYPLEFRDVLGNIVLALDGRSSLIAEFGSIAVVLQYVLHRVGEVVGSVRFHLEPVRALFYQLGNSRDGGRNGGHLHRDRLN